MNETVIRQAWNQVFPNSAISVVRGSITDSIFVRGFIAKDKSEVANGIFENDPLSYMFIVDENDQYSETLLSLSVTPSAQKSWLAYESIKLRKRTVKNVTYNELVKRFTQIKQFIMENADKFKNPMFDITTK